MVKNITMSAEAELIKKARQKAQRDQTTLNAEFRKWLKRYANNKKISDYTDLMKSLSYAQPDNSFTRDELNER